MSENANCQYTTSKGNWHLIIAELAQAGYDRVAKDLRSQIPATLNDDAVFGVWVTEADWDLLNQVEGTVKDTTPVEIEEDEDDFFNACFEVAAYLYNEAANSQDADFAEKMERVAHFLEKQG